VYLEESVQPEDKLYCYGYTDNFPKGESVTFECEGFTGDNPPLLKFKHGQTPYGLSGIRSILRGKPINDGMGAIK
jgi:hypothetical protein